MTKNSLITLLQNKLGRGLIHKAYIRIYLFGSSGHREFPSDIDLLIIYDERFVNYFSLRKLRNFLSDVVSTMFVLRVDICCLSMVEAQGNPFLYDENCDLVWPCS